MAAPLMHEPCRAEPNALHAARRELESAALAGCSTLTDDDQARIANAFLDGWHRRCGCCLDGSADRPTCASCDGSGWLHRRADLAAIATQTEAVRFLRTETSEAEGKHLGYGSGAGLWYDTYHAARRGLFAVDTEAGRSGITPWAYVWEVARHGVGTIVEPEQGALF